jgi:mannitol-1-/sugar-/sorbitol-6-/2-deoxyglucose-6-phosphatase
MGFGLAILGPELDRNCLLCFMLQAVLYDMDGLLADTEPLWQDAEIKVFNALGVPLTRELCRQVMGQRIDEVVKYWYGLYPWQGMDLKTVENQVIEELLYLIEQRAVLLPGVLDSIALVEKRGWKKAVASSSALRIIEHLLQKVGIREHFELVCSAEFEPYGKPHPGIFLSTAEKLGVEPQACLVLEDSVNGVLAGKAARMKVIAVPDHTMANDPRFCLADAKIISLSYFEGALTELGL